MATEQTATFLPERCNAMLARYEQTAAAAESFARARAVLMAREQRTLHGPAPTVGARDAKITLVVFSDFDDPECGRAAPLAHAIENLHADSVRLIFRQLPSVLRPHAHLAAQASLAAQAQGKFWPFHDLLFGNPHAHDREALIRYAKEVGLDVKRFQRDLDRKAFAADVDADLALGRQLRIDTTPALFVDGKQAPFPFGVAELAQVLDTARAAHP
jgi:protein-disulfide isomerase